MKKRTRLSVALLALLLVLTLVATACAKQEEGPNAGNTLLLGSTEFNGVFNEFYGTTAYDLEVADQVALPLLKSSRTSTLEGAASEFIEPELIKDAAGNITHTKYTLKLKEGLLFSDGSKVSVDDVIFTFKVFLDPYYDGLATIFSVPIVGLNEYRYDDPNYKATIQQIEDTAKARYGAEVITFDDFLVYAKDTNLADWWTGDPAGDIGDGSTWSEYATASGYGTQLAAIDATNADQMLELIARIEYDLYLEYYDTVAWASSADLLSYKQGNLADGIDVPEVEGIRIIDDRTIEITIEGIDPTAHRNLSVPIMPKAYYGKDFEKGKLDGTRINQPFGGGAYTFVSYENNIVTLKANDKYYLGKPKIEYIKYQIIAEAAKLESVVQGAIDITDPSATLEMVAAVEAAGLHYELIENLGYGYVGINADRITDKNVRKGIMHLLNRAPAVEAFYGNLAAVIERPISKVSWAYPADAQPVYEYSTEKALEYFKAAGYTQEGGKLMKGGVQLRVEPWMTDDVHPVNPMLTQLKNDLEALGAICEITVAPWSQLSESYRAGLVDLWAAAWQATPDPDMYQIYHSTQIATGNNPYHVNNAELDDLIMQGRATLNIAERQAIYAKALDIVMDEAVEMPFYQRKNLYIMNPNNVNIDTLPDDMTPYYGYLAEVETLELVQKEAAK